MKRWNLSRHFSSSLFGKNPKWTAVRLALVLAAVFVISRFVFMPTVVSGSSMAPTYSDGDVTVVNRLAYVLGEPRRGEVVSVRDGRERLLKRIIGLPGETVAIVTGVVHIDGEPFPEPYVKANAGWNFFPKTLGPNEYLIIGDNRGMAPDHQVFGYVNRDQLLGRTLW